ncbi:MAG TPA: hypothetical protein VII00_04700 [bacterium]
MEKLIMPMVIFLFFLSFPLAAEGLDEGVSLYFNKNYAESITAFEKILDSGQLKKNEILTAESYLGAANFLLDKKGVASGWFLSILKNEPGYELSQIYFPPEIVEFFNELKLSSAPLLFKRREKMLLLNFLPFGAGQFQNHEYIKGSILLGLETAALSINLGSYFTRKALEEDGKYLTDDLSRAKRFQNIQIIAGASFISMYIYGIVDGMLNYEKGNGNALVLNLDSDGNGVVLLYSFNFP